MENSPKTIHVQNKSHKKARFSFGAVLKAQCPSCNQASVLAGSFAIRDHCPVCDYNFHPEPGFYLGAMAVSFLLTAMLTIPPTIVLKVLDVDTNLLILFPFIEFIFVGTFLMFYCRILWLHLEYRMTDRLDGHAASKDSDKK